MSSNLSALMSATFYEGGYDHLIELVHQRDAAAHRRLASLEVTLYDAEGKMLHILPVDPRQEILDLDALVQQITGSLERVLVVFDARYDERVFPYRPHHYAFLHRRGSSVPPLYYAVNAVLGGVPDRIGATRFNHFETYLFLNRPLAERYSLLLGNLSRFAAAEAQVFAYYDGDRTTRLVILQPKAHTEVPLPGEHQGLRLRRVELKAAFRLASYVVGRRIDSGDLVLFDHLFTYLK